MERPRQPKTPAKPAKIRTPAVKPYGPSYLRSITKETYISGPGEPPELFLGGQNSATEWIAYWALAKVFDDPKDPRKPPYFGGRDWGYQIDRLGGYVRAVGSAVIDFVVYLGHTMLGIRIQTERFHIFTASRQQGYDMLQRAELERSGMQVVDVYDTDLLGDPSGAKAVIAMKRAIGMIEPLNPVISGSAIRGSRLRTIR